MEKELSCWAKSLFQDHEKIFSLPLLVIPPLYNCIIQALQKTVPFVIQSVVIHF